MTKNTCPISAQLHAIAIRQVAFAVLAAQADRRAKPLEINLVPGNKSVNPFDFSPTATPPTFNPATIERMITLELAGLAATTVMENPAAGIPDMTSTQAHLMADRLADKMEPEWRSSNPELANEIKNRCYLRAAEVVTTNIDRIKEVATRLAQRADDGNSDMLQP